MLFSLTRLYASLIGGNQLTELPPLISQLRNLRELNIANNLLEFLPFEIMSLQLTSLAVDPNPFKANPEADNLAAAPASALSTRHLGEVTRKYKIVPLTELALRVLLSPPEDVLAATAALPLSKCQERKTVLEALYELPLDLDLSPPIRDVLRACVPGSVASPLSPNATPRSAPLAQNAEYSTTRPQRLRKRPCISVCPSPKHLILAPGEVYRKPIFVTHAQERFTWEKEVAGQKVGGDNGIPIRWRGCSWGCLDHLEQCSGAQVEEDWDMGAPDGESNGETSQAQSAAVVPFSSEGFEFEDDD